MLASCLDSHSPFLLSFPRIPLTWGLLGARQTPQHVLSATFCIHGPIPSRPMSLSLLCPLPLVTVSSYQLVGKFHGPFLEGGMTRMIHTSP